MKTIAILNNKGGVGKTTSCLNLGAGLALRGQRVLLIDLDSQCNLSQSLGIHSSERDIHGAMLERYKPTPIPIFENLSLIPASKELRDLETEFASRIGAQVRLRRILSQVEGFDFCLIDCPPSLSLLSINAMTASDGMIVPLTPEYYSLQGILSLTEAIDEVRESLNPSLTLSGIIINLFDRRKIVHRDFDTAISERFGGLIYRTRIRQSVAIEESPTQGLDIFRYDGTSNGAKDYSGIVDEFLEREKM